MTFRFGAALWAGLSVAIATAAAAVDVVGTTQATLAWAPASGPVTGYYVIVSRDAGPAQVESVSLDASETVGGSFGETLVVQVAAFGADGVAGPLSQSSTPITFVQSSSGGGSGGGSDGGTPPPAGDPPPDGDPGSGGSSGSAPAVHGDYDADGSADLALRVDQSARLWLMQAERVAGEMPLPLMPTGARLVGKGDYDANGSADLLWQNPQTGVLTLWLLDRGAVIDAGELDRSSLTAAEDWRVGGSADFDGDGHDDVLMFSRVAGEIEIWTLDASGVRSRTRHPGYVGARSIVAVGDTDGDGLAQVVWMDELSRDLWVEAPGAAPLPLSTLKPTWRVIGAADGDGDAQAELLLHEPSTGATHVWDIDARAVITRARDLPSAPGAFGGCGDFDGDGREDIAWSDAASGVVTLWLGTGDVPFEVEADTRLGGAELLPGSGADDRAFRDRFCSGDLDGDGSVTSGDAGFVLLPCLREPNANGCEAADLDGDGTVTRADADIFVLRFSGKTCQDR